MRNRQELLKIKSFTDILNNHLHVEVDIIRTRSGYEITTGKRRYDKELSDAFAQTEAYSEYLIRYALHTIILLYKT